MNKINRMLAVYFIAGTQDCTHLAGEPAINLLGILKRALDAGITCFQFRDKGPASLEHQPAEQRNLAIACQRLCRQYQVPFIINDNVELALDIRANGIHVGQGDITPQSIRACSKNILIGLSVNNLHEALEAQANPDVDYLGIGPIFTTNSKPDHSRPGGIDFMRQIRRLSIDKPCVAIGGITPRSAPALRRAGADGVAVISAITQADDINEAVTALKRK
ncbi:thiamine phosphate synthase [Pasteurellaceae bacterium LIM206]|nr:thiamine phosphate synthase [Pasteurellaceae bacterium LIM206]